MSRKPVTHWTIDELKKTVARKLETAKKYQPGPKRQKTLARRKALSEPARNKKMDFERLGATSITLVLFVLFVIAQGYPLGKAETKEGSMKTAWIYVDTNKQVGDVDHLKVFANPDAADGH